MSVKVKRGLGLLVIALLACLAGLALMQIDAIDSDAGSIAVLIAAIVVAIAFLSSLVSGLLLLAWGLLRD